MVVGEAVQDGEEVEARRAGHGGGAAEVVVCVEEHDEDAGVEERRGEGEHAVDVALRRAREHQHVERLHGTASTARHGQRRRRR